MYQCRDALCLQIITQEIATLQHKQSDMVAKIEECKRRQLELGHRVLKVTHYDSLNIMIIIDITKNRPEHLEKQSLGNTLLKLEHYDHHGHKDYRSVHLKNLNILINL